jgi:hydrogenase expression/formation protein HypD
MTLEEISSYLREYSGPKIRLMEVCGSHTAAIAKSGIRGIISDRIELVSGPGCPVCVTPSAYIDKLIVLAKEPDICVASFGDLLRVPGSMGSLSEAKGAGANVTMVYSPMDVLAMAKAHPGTKYVFAAVGFETTAPVYTLLIEEAKKAGLSNIRLLTGLKTMPKAIGWLMDNGAKIDGFLAPGHVCAITGSAYFSGLAERYHIPFAASGFADQELLIAIYGLVRMVEEGCAEVRNFYPAVVETDGNPVAMQKLAKYFTPCEATWRGMGAIADSGLRLRDEYASYDAGSMGLDEDRKKNKGCCCGEILKGNMRPYDCPLFGKVCSPQNPQGACMVSYEGSCFQAYENR